MFLNTLYDNVKYTFKKFDTLANSTQLVLDKVDSENIK